MNSNNSSASGLPDLDSYKANPTRFPCTLCGKEFKGRGKLEMHILTHTTEKANSCPTCGRRFSHITSLHRHEATHLENQPPGLPGGASSVNFVLESP
ncbi:oocyte zinc finger protein XlCOF19-like [Folsomia candida]|uniref:oocyte zinc finger protein XlCOF19-like n=1 Tax=Folsomia candida TaxID=158441 RepID=UPI001604EEAC|nr:oocyte zinc finger protein XlCOF19-like [Folsomia candida]